MAFPIRVAILDDHPAIAAGYQTRLSQESDIEVTDTVLYGEDLLPALAKKPADVLLLDVQVKVSDKDSSPYNTSHLIPRLHDQYPEMNILVISNYDALPLIESLLNIGALGYVLKDDAEAFRDLPLVVRRIARGELYLSQRVVARLLRPSSNRVGNELTEREVEALSLCATYPDERLGRIAERMDIAPPTVRAIMVGIYRKLQVNCREAAVVKARQVGLLPPLSAEPVD